VAVHIIELNDRNIRISNAESILGSSPGFVNIAHTTPIFGEEAQQQSRLHPRQSFNQFWSQLSLDALVNSNNHYRHQADLAYAHLNELTARYDIEGDVIFAVPSNYNREQLAILLGLVKQSPFNAVGLVDLAILNSANTDVQQPAVFVDIQLHQTVLTVLEGNDNQLAKGKVLQIPGTGLLALYDAWTNMITDEFIKQSRFDPQHNADTEQYIYIQLTQWLIDTIKKNEVLLEINNKGAVHQAKVNLGHFEQRARSIVNRIGDEILTLTPSGAQVYLPDGMGNLPGISLYLSNVIALDNSAPIDNCFANLDHLRGDPESLGLVTSIPTRVSGNSKVEAQTTGADALAPSHILLDHKAFALSASAQYLGITSHDAVKVVDSAEDAVLTITRQPQGLLLHANPSQLAACQPSLNGESLSDDVAVQLGDIIRFSNSPTTIQFIQVL
jgi:hypothetical protein